MAGMCGDIAFVWGYKEDMQLEAGIQIFEVWDTKRGRKRDIRREQKWWR